MAVSLEALRAEAATVPRDESMSFWESDDDDVDLAGIEFQELWPKTGETKALFLDYDGTLRELEERPEMAEPTAELHALMRALCARKDLVVHIISGRDEAFLRRHFGMYDVVLIAEHERRVIGPYSLRRPTTDQGNSVAGDEWKALVRELMATYTESTPGGTFVEEKSTGLVWHHGQLRRQAGKFINKLLAGEVEELKRRAGSIMHGVRATLGRQGLEVARRHGTKGEVMKRLLQDRLEVDGGFKSVFIAGDDVSDETMFKNAAEEFVTVKVGEEPTSARFRVDSPADLRAFLWRIATQ